MSPDYESTTAEERNTRTLNEMLKASIAKADFDYHWQTNQQKEDAADLLKSLDAAEAYAERVMQNNWGADLENDDCAGCRRIKSVLIRAYGAKERGE